MATPTIDPDDADGLLEIMRTREEGWFISELMDKTKLHPRDILVLLMRLEDDRGQVSSTWASPAKDRNSPRRLYSTTPPLAYVAQGN